MAAAEATSRQSDVSEGGKMNVRKLGLKFFLKSTESEIDLRSIEHVWTDPHVPTAQSHSHL